MLGLLLARAGLSVTVLEKHADFFRDFRGDTIHPSTLTLLEELGLLERFLELPIHRVDTLDVLLNGERFSPLDFRTLEPPADFLVLAPQWDLLDFLAREGERYPTFEIRMGTNADAIVTDGDRVTGVDATGPDGPVRFEATLTVAADGRHSTLRESAGMTAIESGVPIDVLWFDLVPGPDDDLAKVPPTLFALDRGGFALAIPRGDHWQGGYVIEKGGFEALRSEGIERFRERVGTTAPFMAGAMQSVRSWEGVKLLSIQIDHLERWYRPGFICIGDAAHAMSPVGGVGVNYAVQDAVALANAVVAPLRAGAVPELVLAGVQARREEPVFRMQRIQRFVHARLKRAALGKGSPVPLAAMPLLRRLIPRLRRRITRLMGIGFLPEHIQTGPEHR